MRFQKTAIDGFLVVELESRKDFRGEFRRTFCEAEFAEAGIAFRAVQTNLSFNPHVYTLRGMHFQTPPHGEPKVVSCLRGRIYDVAVDMRPDSSTFLGWDAVELTPEQPRMLYLAKGLAHGFLSLEPDSLVHYLMGATYVPGAARGVRWNDPTLSISWPAVPAVISSADAAHPLLKGNG